MIDRLFDFSGKPPNSKRDLEPGKSEVTLALTKESPRLRTKEAPTSKSEPADAFSI
jgi:hypothetical protein